MRTNTIYIALAALVILALYLRSSWRLKGNDGVGAVEGLRNKNKKGKNKKGKNKKGKKNKKSKGKKSKKSKGKKSGCPTGTKWDGKKCKTTKAKDVKVTAPPGANYSYMVKKANGEQVYVGADGVVLQRINPDGTVKAGAAPLTIPGVVPGTVPMTPYATAAPTAAPLTPAPIMLTIPPVPVATTAPPTAPPPVLVGLSAAQVATMGAAGLNATQIAQVADIARLGQQPVTAPMGTCGAPCSTSTCATTQSNCSVIPSCMSTPAPVTFPPVASVSCAAATPPTCCSPPQDQCSMYGNQPYARYPM